MNRKLLPYEHDLIATLGVTEEEYLDFLAVQHDYTRTPEEKLLTPQNDPIITSIILVVVGILFQVAAMLLMPRPDSARNQNRPRDQRFSPRLGFNTTQELGQYGNPLNLIYCNTRQNPKGAVRAAMSLVWSSVDSYGSSQFMQLLLVLGAASVKRLDFARTAFGQLPISELGPSSSWLYYQESGRVLFGNQRFGDSRDPVRQGAPDSDDACKIVQGSRRREGFSQAFSPTSKNSLGVYDIIPINVEVIERSQNGNAQNAPIGVTIAENGWNTRPGGSWRVGDRITIVFAKTPVAINSLAKEAAEELRSQYVNGIDFGSLYNLGTAKFKLVGMSDNVSTDQGEVTATLECVEGGRRPATEYNRQSAIVWNDQAQLVKFFRRPETSDPFLNTFFKFNNSSFAIALSKRNGLKTQQQFQAALDILTSPYSTPSSKVPGLNSVSRNSYYKGVRVEYGVDGRRVVTVEGFILEAFGEKYDFHTARTASWTDVTGVPHTYTLVTDGSIAYTRSLYETSISGKPKISTEKLRKAYAADLRNVKKLRDAVAAGRYDRQLRNVKTRRAIAKEIENEIALLQEKAEALRPTNKKKQLREIEKEIERRREDLVDLLEGDKSERREAYVEFLYEADAPFTGVNKKRYPSGVAALENLVNGLSGEQVTDQIGADAISTAYQALIAEKEDAVQFLEFSVKNWENLTGSVDDFFFHKCLSKVDVAAYQTITECDYVKFALKCRLFRRISGRQSKYGERNAPDGYRLSDNGVKGRVAFFKIDYKRIEDREFAELPLIFAVRRSSDLDNFIGINFKGASAAKWQFRLEPIADIGAETAQNGQRLFAFIENAGRRATYTYNNDLFWWTGRIITATSELLKPALAEKPPLYTNEWDLFSTRSDTQIQFSFDNGPEFSVTAVTEQQLGSLSGKYADMSMLAFDIFSGRGVQDLRSVTGYVLEGKNSYVVNERTGAYGLSNNSTSYAPDIFADTVLDPLNGIGKFAKPDGIDWDSLALAKRFCKNSGLGCSLFMDGVIAEPASWRQFWAETAPFSLLEFGRVGGKEALIPAIPTDRSGRALRPDAPGEKRIELTISALFNQGNILEGSYKEEFLDYGASTQDIIASVIFRQTESNDMFPRDVSVDVSFKDVDPSLAIRQTFNISQFVTQREQAILFAKLLCNQRRWIRRGIEFQTFPTDSPLSPGAYIYVDVGLNTWDRITSGVIMSDGELNAPLNARIRDGAYSILIYKGGEKVRSFDGITVTNNVAAELAPYAGYLFVLGSVAQRKRVFRVNEIQMDEQGEVTVRAMEHPCDVIDGKLYSKIADFSDNLFSIS